MNISGETTIEPETIEEPTEVVPTYRLRMALLTWTFPSLREADGVHAWEPERFDDWLMSGAPGHGARCAGRFLLSVWDPDHPWRSGRFELHEALGCWDQEHRAAFGAWVAAPWWP